MKKFLLMLTIAVTTSVMFLASAYAIPTLPGPGWKIKFQNYEYFNPALAPTTTISDISDPDQANWTSVTIPGNVDPTDTTEDNWGIAQVTDILKGIGSSSTPHWDFDDDKYQVFAIFGGMSVTNWTFQTTTTATGTTSGGTFTTGAATITADGHAVDPFIDFYLVDSTAVDYEAWGDLVQAGPGGRIGAYGYDGITNGSSAQLLAAFDLVSGINGSPDVITTGSASGSNPPTGQGSGYADLDLTTPGLWTDQIKQDIWPTPFGDRDTKLVFNFDDLGEFGWNLSSDDPFEGGGKIPEPATMMLFGFGLLSLAAAGRKK